MMSHDLARMLLLAPNCRVTAHANNHTVSLAGRIDEMKLHSVTMFGEPILVIGNLSSQGKGDLRHPVEVTEKSMWFVPVKGE